MKKHTVLLLIMLFFVTIFYLPLVNAYFQQDEWLAFGNYYGLSNHGFASLFVNAFAPNIGHYIPLYFLSFYGLVKVIGTNFMIWQLVSIFWHLVITYFVYVFLKKLFSDEKLSLIGATLFGFSGSAHQATSWVIADTNTHGAALFGLFSLYFTVLAAKSVKNSQRYLILSVAMFLVSLLFKETTIALFVCTPLLYFTIKDGSISKAFKFLFIPWGGAGLGYILLRGLMFILPVAKSSASVATQSQTIPQIAINMTTFPAKALVESLIPSKWMLRLTESLLGRIHLTGGNDVHTTGFVEFVTNFLATTFVLIFIVFVVFAVISLVRNVKDQNARLMAFSIAFVSLNSLIFALSPERTGIITFIDSRNLYFLLIGSLVFLIAFVRFTTIYERYSKLFYSFIIILFVLNITAAFADFKQLISDGQTRVQILSQISKHTPAISARQVILLQSDSSYYGLPQEQQIPPFQSGFGQALLVYLAEKDEFPYSLYSQNFLWSITAQGYQENNGRGFGYYRNYHDLLLGIKENNISPQEVFAFAWRSQTEALTNQTESIRAKLMKDLK